MKIRMKAWIEIDVDKPPTDHAEWEQFCNYLLEQINFGRSEMTVTMPDPDDTMETQEGTLTIHEIEGDPTDWPHREEQS